MTGGQTIPGIICGAVRPCGGGGSETLATPMCPISNIDFGPQELNHAGDTGVARGAESEA